MGQVTFHHALTNKGLAKKRKHVPTSKNTRLTKRFWHPFLSKCQYLTADKVYHPKWNHFFVAVDCVS